MTSRSLLFGFGILIAAHAAQALPVSQSLPTIGSPNTVTADPPVARRPRTRPCRTRLFTDVRFADFSPKLFDYAPPSACPGPWQKVVLEADTSALWGTAEIAFYPFKGRDDDRRSQTPDLVLPLSASPSGGTVALFSPSDSLAPTFQLPMH